MALIERIVTLELIATVHTLPARGPTLQCREDHAWQVGYRGAELAAWVKLHKIAGVPPAWTATSMTMTTGRRGFSNGRVIDMVRGLAAL